MHANVNGLKDYILTPDDAAKVEVSEMFGHLHAFLENYSMCHEYYAQQEERERRKVRAQALRQARVAAERKFRILERQGKVLEGGWVMVSALGAPPNPVDVSQFENVTRQGRINRREFMAEVKQHVEG